MKESNNDIVDNIVDKIIAEQEKIVKTKDVLVRDGADLYTKLEELKEYVVDNFITADKEIAELKAQHQKALADAKNQHERECDRCVTFDCGCELIKKGGYIHKKELQGVLDVYEKMKNYGDIEQVNTEDIMDMWQAIKKLAEVK